MIKTKEKYVGLVSLGCDKNRVDTEIMLTYLSNAGFGYTNDPKKAHIIIINTCAFIESARNEALEVIEEMLKYKKSGCCEKVIVTGCMPQNYLPILKKEFKKVDAFVGIDNYDKIVKVIKDLYNKNEQIELCGNPNRVLHVKNRIITTPAHFAYLKIADGCENYCTFCTIPYIRGKYRSKPIELLVEEAQELVDGGAKELILVAQDVTKYGTDLVGKPMLVDLIKKLSKIKELKWIRLLYCYPELVTDELLKEMVKNPKLCNYLDIPLQHVADNVLKNMNRHVDYAGTIKLIEKIQALKQKVYLRTTFMVGFPGETEADHKQLCQFVEKYKLNYVGFFEYSKENGTVAAKMSNQVDEKVKHRWLNDLIGIAEKNVKINNKKLIGETVNVIYEGIDYDLDMFYGRTEFQAPDVDTIIYFKSNKFVDIGNIYPVKITGSVGQDLKGEIL